MIFDGIKAVFNLQTSYDMKYRSIEWESLKNYYDQNQLEVVNFQIIDMNYEDMKNKGLEVVQILRKLIDRFEVRIFFVSHKILRRFMYIVQLE